MKKRAPAIVWLTLAVLSTSCVAYKIKEMSPKAVAAKGGKAESTRKTWTARTPPKSSAP